MNPRIRLVWWLLLCVLVCATAFTVTQRTRPTEAVCKVSYSELGWPSQVCERP